MMRALATNCPHDVKCIGKEKDDLSLNILQGFLRKCFFSLISTKDGKNMIIFGFFWSLLLNFIIIIIFKIGNFFAYVLPREMVCMSKESVFIQYSFSILDL